MTPIRFAEFFLLLLLYVALSQAIKSPPPSPLRTQTSHWRLIYPHGLGCLRSSLDPPPLSLMRHNKKRVSEGNSHQKKYLAKTGVQQVRQLFNPSKTTCAQGAERLVPAASYMLYIYMFSMVCTTLDIFPRMAPLLFMHYESGLRGRMGWMSNDIVQAHGTRQRFRLADRRRVKAFSVNNYQLLVITGY